MVFLIPLVLIVSLVFVFDYVYYSDQNKIIKSQEKKETNKSSKDKQEFLKNILQK